MCFSVKLRVYAAENDTRMISGPILATCWQFALDCKMRTRYNFKKYGMPDLYCSGYNVALPTRTPDKMAMAVKH